MGFPRLKRGKNEMRITGESFIVVEGCPWILLWKVESRGF